MSALEMLGVLLPGLVVVVQVASLSILLVLFFSIGVAMALASEIPLVRTLAKAFVQTFRSIPMLAMMMLIFFGLGALSPLLNISAFWSAVVAITVVEVAYTSEIFRGAIASVDKKQWEAGMSLGMSRWQIYRYVVWRQAVVPAMPPTINMMMWVIKGTALGSLITLNEVTLRANALTVQYAQPLLVYSLVLLTYVCLTVPLGYLGRVIERAVDFEPKQDQMHARRV